MKNIILASLTTLPKLINGKVCVVNPDNNSYTLYNPSRYTEISDNFDPMNYAILKHKWYSDCIVYSTPKEREEYLVNSMIREMLEAKKRQPLKLYGKGDRIHLKSRNGVYEVVACDERTITITCNKWRYEEDKREHFRVVPASDFKCVEGRIKSY